MQIKELVRACDVAILMGLTSQTIARRAERGEIPGAVFIGSTLRFDMDKVQAFIAEGGKRCKQIHHRGSRQKVRVRSGGRPTITSEASQTVQETQIVGVGTDYEHKGMNGRNVSAGHGWKKPIVH